MSGTCTDEEMRIYRSEVENQLREMIEDRDRAIRDRDSEIRKFRGALNVIKEVPPGGAGCTACQVIAKEVLSAKD